MNDDWNRIKRMLEAQGHRTTDGLTRTVSARACGKCHTPVLGAIAGEVCGLPARVDPAPLSPAGEALAVLTGRATYSLRASRGRLELDLRDSYHMREPAGTGKYDVVAEHACGTPPLPSTTSNLPRSTPKERTDQCPF